MRRYGSDLVPVVGTERRSGAAGGAGVRGGARYRLQPFLWWQFVLQDVGLGFAFGLACGLIGSVLMPRPGKSLADAPIPGHQKALYGLGVAFATYSATVLPPRGNGFIAVLVAAVVVGTFLLARPVAIWIPSNRDEHGGQGVHGLVRAQEGRHDGLLDPDPRPADPLGAPDLRPGRTGGVLLDHRAARAVRDCPRPSRPSRGPRSRLRSAGHRALGPPARRPPGPRRDR